MKKLFVLVLVFIATSAFFACTSKKADVKRFSFADLTATDKKTGLMWTRDANMANKDITWHDAVKFVEELNNQKFAGHSDWRLPTQEELIFFLSDSNSEYKKGKGYYLILYKNSGFKNINARGYWSSTIAEGDTAIAHDIFMCGGGTIAYSKAFRFHVWPVRGGK